METMKDSNPKPPRRPLTETAFAKETNQTRRQVRKAVENGEIKSAIFGGRRLIPASEADRINETFA